MPTEGSGLHIIALIKDTLTTHRSRTTDGNEIS